MINTTTNSADPVVRTGETPNLVQAEGVKKQATTSPVVVSKSLNSMGFDDKDIGMNNEIVTYKGQGIVQPSYVENGTAFAPESANYAGAIDYLKNNGYTSLRDGLKNRGVADNRIGWNANTGNVTIDGYDVHKPKYNVDGTTYVSEADLNSVYSKAAELAGDPIVAARDYTMSKTPGVGNPVDWDGENVLIGGQAIKPEYIQDGVAYVKKSQLDPLISNYKESNGLNAREELGKRKFSYDLDSDQVWIDHRDRMTDLAEDAYRRVLNNNNMSANGATGAVLSEANASMNDYLYKLADDAYTYRQDAYKQWSDDYNRDRDLYRDDVTDAYNNNLLNGDEKWRWRDYDFKRDDYRRLNESHEKQMRTYDISNDTNAYSYAVQVAGLRGRFLPRDEAYIPGLAEFRNPDGTYSITPTQFEMLYTEDAARAAARGQSLGYRDVYGN